MKFELSSVICRKLWHEGLLFKLCQSGIDDRLLAWLRDYLCDTKQRVVLSDATSDIVSITTGVSQGSILSPRLFLVYINDIETDIHSPIRLFADDTTLYIEVDDPQRAVDCINADLAKIQSWAKSWPVTFNPWKTESLLFFPQG